LREQVQRYRRQLPLGTSQRQKIEERTPILQWRVLRSRRGRRTTVRARHLESIHVRCCSPYPQGILGSCTLSRSRFFGWRLNSWKAHIFPSSVRRCASRHRLEVHLRYSPIP
jgi:hypothetical protein